MQCKSIHKDLIFYIGNELPYEKRTAVEKHLKECADCRNFLAFLQGEMQVMVKEKNPELSPFFYTRLSARLEERPAHSAQKQLTGLLQPAFFSFLLVAGIYTGLRFGSQASAPAVKQQATISIQLFNDFEAEPIESFLLDKL